MPRTASPVTPGTNPTSSSTQADPADQAGTGDQQREADAEGAVGVTGSQTGDSPTTQELQAQIAELMKRDQQREAELHELRSRRAVAAEPPAPVQRPTMAETLKQKPTSPVLTTEGWYVPAVLPGPAGKN